MKKILPKLALALLPVALYLAFFLTFEPNNYFGLHASGSDNSPIARIRAYQAAPANAVILGDSRMAHFDMALVNKTSGRTFSNVAYGGAGLEESIDEFYFLYGQNPEIDTVVFGLSFYTLNAAYKPVNRMKTVETQLANPAAYVFNLEYNINALTVAKDKLTAALRGAPYTDAEETAEHAQSEYHDAAGALPFRADLIDYAATLYANCAAEGASALPARVYATDGALQNARDIAQAAVCKTPAQSKFAVDEAALDALCSLADFCREHGVSLTLVLPPMDASVRALVCEPLGIDAAMAPALKALAATGAQLLDYEWAEDPAYPDTAYYDGFHLDTRHGLPQWTKTLFSEVQGA